MLPTFKAGLPPATVSPAFLSGVHRRLAVSVSIAGVLIRPAGVELHEYDGSAVKIPWGSSKPEAIQWREDGDLVFNANGIAGLLRGPGHGSYLILVTDSVQSATLPDARKSAISSVTALVAIPLKDYDSARLAIAKYSVRQSASLGEGAERSPTARSAPETDEDYTEDETDDEDDGVTTDGGETTGTETEADARPPFPPEAPRRPLWKKAPSLLRKLSGKPPGPTTAPAQPAVSIDESASITPSSADPLLETPSSLPDIAAAASSSTTNDRDAVRAAQELDQKVLAETLRTLRGMSYSCEIDITRNIQRKFDERSSDGDGSSTGLVEPNPTLPLWRRADRRFFWNANLMAPFIEAGLHSYVLVLQQGFVGQATVTVPLKPFDDTAPVSLELDLVLISRRSVERPGLRYQRRGINPDGQVANFVETEFIVSARREDAFHIGSFVQTRGSIPVFWSQSPWALKPPPTLERTPEASQAALDKHFANHVKRYGKTLAVNLAEATGKEAVVVDAYRSGIEKLDRPDVSYLDFDFHHECRGMRFENVSKLISRIKSELDEMGNFWLTDQQGVLSAQLGTVRTNCIDCLDRTNVVQSALARYFLNRHLMHLGVTSQEELGAHDALAALWADNGDAISREYAGTSALKGDFTRTGKRNWRGAVNDATNSVARLMQGAVSDFFRQAVLDYVLGVNSDAFQEYAERLQSSDPGKLVQLRKIRDEAIETSAREVLSEGEDKVAGWMMLSPVEFDTSRSPKGQYRERCLLLSSKAIYVVDYEFTLQKVIGFTRIPLGDIVTLQTGAYILSSLDAATRDPTENYGILISYRDHAVTEREHTYTIESVAKDEATSVDTTGSLRSIAFKALKRDAVRTSDGQSRIVEKRESNHEENHTAKDLVQSMVVPVILEEARKNGADCTLEEGDIISAADARAHTSVFDRLGHTLSKAIWL